MKHLLIILLLLTSCTITPTAPDRTADVTSRNPIPPTDGSVMGCRALASHFAVEAVKNMPDLNPDSEPACNLYRIIYEGYRAQITDDSDFCPCPVRDMVDEIENNGGDVPDFPIYDPIC